MHQSKSFGSERAFREHVVSGHGMGREVRDLRADVEEGFQNNEARASFPHLDWLDATTGLLLAAGGPIKLLGRNLLQGQTFDHLTLGAGAAGVVYESLKPGESNTWVEVVQGAGALAAAFVTNTKSRLAFGLTHLDTVVRAKVAGTAGDRINVAIKGDSPTGGGVTLEESGTSTIIHFEAGVSTVTNVETALAGSTLIEVETAGTGASVLTVAGDTKAATYLTGGGRQRLTVTLAAGGSTATAVAGAVNAEPTCIGRIWAEILSGGGGTVLVASQTALAGGEGLYAGNKIWVAGVEVLPTQMADAWTDTALYVTVPVLTGKAATDLVNVMISSDGVTSEALSGVLA